MTTCKAYIAPLVVGDFNSRNIKDFYANHKKMNNASPRPNSSFKPLKVNLPTVPVTDSPGLKGATSLNSLPMSTTADDTPKYFWDSFDLNHDNAEAGNAGHSEVPAANSNADNASFVSTADSSSKQAPAPTAQVDPTRDPIATIDQSKALNT